MNASNFMVIAHRGASSYAPENTLAAFDLALHMGVHQIELDVHFSSDGHIVVIHDDTVDRTANDSGLVASKPLAELRALEAGADGMTVNFPDKLLAYMQSQPRHRR